MTDTTVNDRFTSQLFVLFAESKAITGFMNDEPNLEALKKADRAHLETIGKELTRGTDEDFHVIEDNDYITELEVGGIPMMRFERCF